jgi:hypothetical protein
MSACNTCKGGLGRDAVRLPPPRPTRRAHVLSNPRVYCSVACAPLPLLGAALRALRRGN